MTHLVLATPGVPEPADLPVEPDEGPATPPLGPNDPDESMPIPPERPA